MFRPTESDSPSVPNLRLIEQALKALKQNVNDQETRLDRLCVSWHKTWLSQCDDLRNRIDTLEARLSPWMNERPDGPRLAVISQQEDAA
ncbi:hypothetical protein [Schlesneria paludicola]|uniref:hypothetical protein n=1 Tax=Schlesneria paludicola TaxID=360056 RepID=UPI000299D738|nr:hypothetical protein [Schlesneria paludicola]